MTANYCPKCGSKIEIPNANNCSNCGQSLRPGSISTNGKKADGIKIGFLPGCLIIIVAVIIVGIFV